MSRNRVIKISGIGLVFLLVCAVILPGIVDANKDERPVRPIKLSIEGQLNRDTELALDYGIASHLGKVVNTWKNNDDYVDEDGLEHKIANEGELVAANGDIIFWVMNYTITANGYFEGDVYSTGGTGRFEDVEMHLFATGQIYAQDDVYNYYTYSAEGTISY